MANCVKCNRQIPGFSMGKRLCEWCVRYEAMQRGEEPTGPPPPIITAPWRSRRSTPVALTQLIVAINVVVFVVMVLKGVSIFDPESAQLLAFGANYGPYTLDAQWWRAVTCMFLHIGIIHIGLNMWCLWSLGELAESLYGHWTFGAIYLISGVGGSIASILWHPHGLSAGASGAIFGLAGAMIASFYLGEFSAPRSVVKSLQQSVVMFAGYNLLFGAVSGVTDNAAHIGGLITGLALGALVARLAPDPNNFIRRIAVILLVALAVSGSFLWLRHARGYGLPEDPDRTLLRRDQPGLWKRDSTESNASRPTHSAAYLTEELKVNSRKVELNSGKLRVTTRRMGAA